MVKVSKKYLPKLSCGYGSSKHELHIGCGKEFLKQFREEFDVVITDSSDSVGTCRKPWNRAVRKSVDTVYSFIERLC